MCLFKHDGILKTFSFAPYLTAFRDQDFSAYNPRSCKKKKTFTEMDIFKS